MSAKTSWAKFGRYMARVKRRIPKEWEKAVPRSNRVIIRNMERNEPTLKGAFKASTTVNTKVGHESEIRSREGYERKIINREYGSPGHSGRGPYPLYFKPEDRQKQIDRIKAEEAEWYAKGAFRSGESDRRVSAYAELKLWIEGILIRYGPFKGAVPHPFIKKSVQESIPDILDIFTKVTERSFK